MVAAAAPSVIRRRPSGPPEPSGLMTTRITGGSQRGQRLRSARGPGLRPTSERVRAAIFSMIGGAAVENARVLDLYAGTGAMGIEALSRGASWADFAEVHAGRCRDIRDSLLDMGLDERGRVYRARVEKALDLVDGDYGLVLIDPPYELDPWSNLMERLGTGRLLAEGAYVVAEHYQKRQLAEIYGGLVRVKSRRHGDTSISIYRAGA